MGVSQLDRARRAAASRAEGIPMTVADVDAVYDLAAQPGVVTDDVCVCIDLWFDRPCPDYSLRAFCAVFHELNTERQATPTGDGIPVGLGLPTPPPSPKPAPREREWPQKPRRGPKPAPTRPR